MSSYQGSTSVAADAKSIFEFVRDPENLPKFVSCISHADLGFGEALHIRGECPHGKFFGVGTLHVEPEEMRIRWDSRANVNYRGMLKVMEAEDHTSVLIHLEFDPGMDREANTEFAHLIKEHPALIQAAIEDALAKLKLLCEPAAITAG